MASWPEIPKTEKAVNELEFKVRIKRQIEQDETSILQQRRNEQDRTALLWYCRKVQNESGHESTSFSFTNVNILQNIK